MRERSHRRLGRCFLRRSNRTKVFGQDCAWQIQGEEAKLEEALRGNEQGGCSGEMWEMHRKTGRNLTVIQGHCEDTGFRHVGSLSSAESKAVWARLA